MKNANIKLESKGNGCYNVINNGVKVGSYKFYREIVHNFGPVCNGFLINDTTKEEIDLSSIAYAKDAKKFVIEYFSV